MSDLPLEELARLIIAGELETAWSPGKDNWVPAAWDADADCCPRWGRRGQVTYYPGDFFNRRRNVPWATLNDDGTISLFYHRKDLKNASLSETKFRRRVTPASADTSTVSAAERSPPAASE